MLDLVQFILTVVLLLEKVNGMVQLPGVCTQVSLYGDYNYQGFMYHHVIREKDGCINIEIGEAQLGSIRTHGSCVLLFSNFDCVGKKLRVTRDIPLLSAHDFDLTTRSFKSCPQDEAIKPNPKPQFSLFNHTNYHTVMINYYDLCWCQTLPRVIQNILSSAHTYHQCLRLWDQEECQGNWVDLNPGEFHTNLHLVPHDFADRTKSVSVCADFEEQCIRLHGIVKKVSFDLSQVKKVLAKSPPSKRLEVAQQTLVVNSGRSSVIQYYVESRKIEETFVFQRLPSFSKLQSLTVDKNLEIELSGGESEVPSIVSNLTSVLGSFLGSAFSKLTSKITDTIFPQYDADISSMWELRFRDALKKAFTYQAVRGSGWVGPYVFKGSRMYQIDERFTIPKSNSYAVRSFIDVAENIEIPYTVELIGYGTDHAREMISEEVVIMAREVGFDDVEPLQGKYVKMSTKGTLQATFPVRAHTEIDALGFKIPFINIDFSLPEFDLSSISTYFEGIADNVLWGGY